MIVPVESLYSRQNHEGSTDHPPTALPLRSNTAPAASSTPKRRSASYGRAPGETFIAELCLKEGIQPAVYY
jgi:hypothetical protein